MVLAAFEGAIDVGAAMIATSLENLVLFTAGCAGVSVSLVILNVVVGVVLVDVVSC
jgi:hypothetical protein